MEDEIVDLFVAMGFQVAEGPEIEDDFHNFGALNIPRDHPARDMHDTFYVAGADDVLLRTHTSPVQIRVMRAMRPPLRVIVPGTSIGGRPRRTHSPMFQQIEGSWVDERVTFADLKGVLIHFLQRLFGARRRCASDRASSRSRNRRRESTSAASAVRGRAAGPIAAAASARAADGSRSSAAGWCTRTCCAPSTTIPSASVASRSAWESSGHAPPSRMAELRAFYDNDLRFLEQF
jgi:hypothetical protein